ncbi:uncharacterized protein K444DRAFT_543805, partial [Hyaloscypha bicolor E]
REQANTTALTEVETLAKALEIPLIDAIILLANNRKSYISPLALELATQEAEAPATPAKRALFTKSIVNTYIIAILEL